jgi:hypothetical protein
MSMGRKIDCTGKVPRSVLLSLRETYAIANRQAAALIRAYRRNPLALLDLQGEIERAADKANDIALRTRADGF